MKVNKAEMMLDDLKKAAKRGDQLYAIKHHHVRKDKDDNVTIDKRDLFKIKGLSLSVEKEGESGHTYILIEAYDSVDILLEHSRSACEDDEETKPKKKATKKKTTNVIKMPSKK
jgi:hypothetical protein